MIILLGSSGFIGKALSDYFKSKKIPFKGISSKDIDLTKTDSIEKLVNIFDLNSIVIFASSIIREKGDNFENMQKNINMAMHVSEAVKLKPIKKLIFISSIDVYGISDETISENTLNFPQTLYGISKLTSEQILQISTTLSKIPLVILRLGGIFGLGQSEKKYGPNSFIHSFLMNKLVTIYGDGKELRDLIYIKDLIKIILHFITSSKTGIINITTGHSLSFLKIVQALEKITKKKIRLIKKPRNGPKFDIIFDNLKLKKTLPSNFKFTPLETSLKEILDSNKDST